ncbi:MAG TPA: Na+/H+ antiporter NhaC family protein [Longimicrobiales bacterium]|nr:Na+/H+ antiporter NhaC family protein [Longimicrobiales bacterium]
MNLHPPTPASGAPPLRFRGGTVGALAPLGLFLAGVSWLGLSGAPDETGFWPILLAALTLGILLARDKEGYTDAVVAGMARPLVMVMILAWILAGVLGTLLRESGMVETLVWAARSAGVAGGGYVAMAFLVSAVFSTATGTSLGTLLVCTPLLYPVGPALGADPAFLLGAILGGATFGDNVSPISDTTIASAGTQGADLAGVVRSRMRYALPAAAVSLVAAAWFGGGERAVASVQAAPGAPPVAGAAMLLVPVVVLALLLRKRGLMESLMAGVLLAAALGLALGAFAPSDLLGVNRDDFIATGLLLDGMRRAVGISIFTLLLMGLVGGIEASGLMDRLLVVARARARGPRSAEAWIFATVSAAVILTTHAVVAILAVGPLTKEAGRSFGLGRYRRSNLLDVTVCTYPFLLPFFIPTILASALTGGFDGAPRLSPWSAGLHNVHSWGLLAVILLAIVTGWGRADRPT